MKAKLPWIVLLGVSFVLGILLSGYVYNQFYFFGSFDTSLFLKIMAGILIIGLLIYGSSKSKIVLGSTMFIVTFSLTAVIAAATVRKIGERRAKNLGEEVIQATYSYRMKTGFFPKNIDCLNITSSKILRFKRTQTYSLDDSGKNFYLKCWYDGWYYHIFLSRDSSWQLCE